MENINIEELESRLAILDKLLKLGWILLISAFVLGGWVTTIELRTQSLTKETVDIENNFNKSSQKLDDILVWKAGTEANRYTVQQAVAHNTLITELINTQDKRIQRLEDNYQVILKSLERLESKIDISSHK